MYLQHSILRMVGAPVQRNSLGKPGRAPRGGARQGRCRRSSLCVCSTAPWEVVKAGVLAFDAGAALTYNELQESGWTGSYDKLPPDCIRCANSV